MEIVFLIKGKKERRRFLEHELPDEISLSVMPNEISDTEHLSLITLSMQGETIDCAKVLARVRDELYTDDHRINIKLAIDGASEKFQSILISAIQKYELALRKVLIIASCVDEKTFDSPIARNLEKKSLDEIGLMLFTDQRTIDEARKIAGAKDRLDGEYLSKQALLREIEKLDEHIPWNDLFKQDEIATVRENYLRIKDWRNAAMHFHLLSEKEFLQARKTIGRATFELEAYYRFASVDKGYAKDQSLGAQVAAAGASNNLALITERLNEAFRGLFVADAMSPSLTQLVNSVNSLFSSEQFTDVLNKISLNAASLSSFTTQERGLADNEANMLKSDLLSAPRSSDDLLPVRPEKTFQEEMEQQDGLGERVNKEDLPMDGDELAQNDERNEE